MRRLGLWWVLLGVLATMSAQAVPPDTEEKVHLRSSERLNPSTLFSSNFRFKPGSIQEAQQASRAEFLAAGVSRHVKGPRHLVADGREARG